MGRSPDEDVALCNDVRGAGGFLQLCISEDFIAVQARISCDFLAFVSVVGAWAFHMLDGFSVGANSFAKRPVHSMDMHRLYVSIRE